MDYPTYPKVKRFMDNLGLKGLYEAGNDQSLEP